MLGDASPSRTIHRRSEVDRRLPRVVLRATDADPSSAPTPPGRADQVYVRPSPTTGPPSKLGVFIIGPRFWGPRTRMDSAGSSSERRAQERRARSSSRQLLFPLKEFTYDSYLSNLSVAGAIHIVGDHKRRWERFLGRSLLPPHLDPRRHLTFCLEPLVRVVLQHLLGQLAGHGRDNVLGLTSLEFK